MEEEEVTAVANWQVCFLKVGIKGINILFLSYLDLPELPQSPDVCRAVFSYHLVTSFKQKSFHPNIYM